MNRISIDKINLVNSLMTIFRLFNPVRTCCHLFRNVALLKKSKMDNFLSMVKFFIYFANTIQKTMKFSKSTWKFDKSY